MIANGESACLPTQFIGDRLTSRKDPTKRYFSRTPPEEVPY